MKNRKMEFSPKGNRNEKGWASGGNNKTRVGGGENADYATGP